MYHAQSGVNYRQILVDRGFVRPPVNLDSIGGRADLGMLCRYHIMLLGDLKRELELSGFQRLTPLGYALFKEEDVIELAMIRALEKRLNEARQ